MENEGRVRELIRDGHAEASARLIARLEAERDAAVDERDTAVNEKKAAVNEKKAAVNEKIRSNWRSGRCWRPSMPSGATGQFSES